MPNGLIIPIKTKRNKNLVRKRPSFAVFALYKQSIQTVALSTLYSFQFNPAWQIFNQDHY